MRLCRKCQREIPEGGRFCPFCSEPAPVEAPRTSRYEGKVIAEKYFVEGLLGRGGMGEIYKARHLSLDKPIALKLLRSGLGDDPAIVQRFHREARAASRIDHPNSVNIIDFGQTEDGALFIAMEYLGGRPLGKLIADEFPLGDVRIVHIAKQILAALAEAHALGVVHRDLKPDNVYVESRRGDPDFVKVLDFGIARLREPGADAPRLTTEGFVPGTPGYMSPEQARGVEIDARSDLYAVGVIIYEMVTGALPYDGETPVALMTKCLVEAPIPMRERNPQAQVSPALEAIVLRAMSIDLDRRFASADEMREALVAVGLPAPVARPTPLQTPSATLVLPSKPSSGSGARPAPGEQGRQPAATVALPRKGGPKSPSSGSPMAVSPHDGAPAADRQVTSPAKDPAVDAAASVSDAPASTRSAHPAPSDDAPTSMRSSHPTPPDGRRRPGGAIVAAVAGGALVVGLALWWFTSPTSEPSPKAQVPGGSAGVLQGPVATTPPPTPQPPAPAAVPSPQPPAPLPSSTPAPSPAAAPTPAPAPSPMPAAAPTLAPTPTPARSPTPTLPPRTPAAGRPGRVVTSSHTLKQLKVPMAPSGLGLLVVNAKPWGQIKVNGAKYGESPVEFLVDAGTFQVTATHPEFGSYTRTVTVKPGERKQCVLEPQRQTATCD